MNIKNNKIWKILLFVYLYFCVSINVKAASLCSYQEQTSINQKAANIKVKYEVGKDSLTVEANHLGLTPEEKEEINNEYQMEYKIFTISILNVTDEFYVVVKNNQTQEEQTYTNENAQDGIIKFNWENIDKVTNFTIKVYTTNKTSCPGEVYKTLYLTTPRYNENYDREICQDLKDYYLCQEFVTFDAIDEEKFLSQINSYRMEHEKEEDKKNEDKKADSFTDKIFNFIDDYKWIILVVIIISVSGFTITKVVKNKKQRDRL